MKYLRLIIENALRNPVRTLLTTLGTMVLVFVVTMVWSILSFLDSETASKGSNFKAIVTERWRLPSQMPYAYADSLRRGAAREPGDVEPNDSMTWSFFGGSLDPERRTRESSLFAFALQPEKLMTMMDELDELPADQAADLDQAVEKMTDNRQGIILGRDRLTAINKRVGDRITLHGFNYEDINLELEIVGLFPPGRYDNSAAINVEYLNAALDAYPQTHNGQEHPLADKSLNLVWLRVPDTDAYKQVAEQIMNSPDYSSPAVKVETASSGVATFLEAYRDLVWGMRWLLAPAVLITLSLVISNAISISVRERQTEFAVLKVLGFKPLQILSLVIGESLLVGATAGFLSAALTWGLINYVMGGFTFPIAFFGIFYIPDAALWWGLAVGGTAALLGSCVPAWTACKVRVSEVFARVG